MNKQEIAAVVALFLLLMGWFIFQQKEASKAQAARAAEMSRVAATNAVPAQGGATNAAPAQVAAEPTPPKSEPALVAAVETNAAPVAAMPTEKHETPEPVLVVLSNRVTRITVSSWGGGITAVELKKYRTTLAKSSPPMVLDLAPRQALSLAGVPGLSTNSDFTVSAGGDSRSVRLSRTTDQNLCFERTITLGDSYRVDVIDTFRNDNAATSTLPVQSVQLGPMRLTETKPSSMGLSYIGVDTLADTVSEVHYWGKKELPAAFGGSASMSCARPNVAIMPTNAAFSTNFPVAWTGVKNKYFVQILAPETSGSGFEWAASRSTASSGAFLIDQASAAMRFAARDLKPGETLTRKMSYFAGPKEYASLKSLGNHQDDVMEFGFWEWFRWLCKALLWTLNGLYMVIPNYGIAVILLTLIVRIVFWPVTHKSTESMKKMQEIQPLVNEVRAKLKDKPQKMNEEVMALYKKHKVNPMAGCLPMLVQIPVFIALFVVLRSAVELRFAPFLWVSDLSEPEGILSSVLPFGGLNILPLLMTATTVWQQKITPSTADPQQQKLMMFMPIVMLFLFYNMASGLVLYWTVSQGLAIAQLVWQQKKTDAKKAALPAA